jgi:hypothetical protein
VNLATVNLQLDLAATRLNSDAPSAGYYNEALVPDGEYSLQARQVLFAAGSAWAFGGMGCQPGGSGLGKFVATTYLSNTEGT